MKAADRWVGHNLNGRTLCRGRIETLYDQKVGILDIANAARLMHCSHMQGTDPIVPTSIEHSIDEVWNGEELDQYYNFIDYHFEESRAYLRARFYLDEPQKVFLSGPFESRQSKVVVAADSTREAVVTYLERRFSKIVAR